MPAVWGGAQVSHHPPVSCWWAEGPGGWRWWGEMEMRSRFWGKSVEMAPVGQAWLQLPDGSLFTWNKPVLTIHNLVLGRLWLDWHGDITVRDHSSGAPPFLAILHHRAAALLWACSCMR